MRGGGGPARYRMFSSIPASTRYVPAAPTNCDNDEMSPDFARFLPGGWGQNYRFENDDIWYQISSLQ